MSDGVRQRVKDELPEMSAGAGFTPKPVEHPHPAGPPKYSKTRQYFQMFGFFCYFLFTFLAVHATQFIGVPFYFLNKDYYYAWMAKTKEFFGVICNSLTDFFAPTKIIVSGDASIRGQLRLTKDGRLETDFPERLVMICNHQIYTDWLYLWWISYTSNMHGHIYIMLKESLKYVPILGPGMMFYGFIFMARNWAKDKPRMEHRLSRLRTHQGVKSRANEPDPAWLLLFPEGTNMSNNGRNGSKRWAEKSGQPDMQHLLLPRSTGLQFCLSELKGTMEWVYDCTIAYEGIPRGQYGQDIYTLRAQYFEGRAPPSVSMYWRRFAIADIPVEEEPKVFEAWLRQKWDEKDRLLEQYHQTGRFPADDGDAHVAKPDGFTETKIGPGGHRYIETRIKNRYLLEFLVVYIPLVGCVSIAYVLYRGVRLALSVF